MSADLAEYKERVRDYFEAIEDHSDGDIEGLSEFVTDDVLNHNPVTSEDVEIDQVRGIEAFEEHLEAFTTAFPDVRFEIQDMIAENDRVAVRFRIRGTHEGRLMGVEPTGREITMSVITIYRFKDGKIAERWGEASR